MPQPAGMFNPFTADTMRTGMFRRAGQILAIDDDESFSRFMTETLCADGHTVVAAKDGPSGLSLARSQKFDLFLVDVTMPGMDGFEVCLRLKSDPELRDIPVMLVTGIESQEAHVRGMEAGANDFLTKPVNLPILRARVASLLQYRHAVAALREAHDELEQRVAERTAELVTTNVKLAQEIASRVAAEKALRVSEERYALAARGSHDGLWDWNLDTNEIYYSPRWEEMVGCEPKSLANILEEWLSRVHPDDVAGLKMAIEGHLAGLAEHMRHEFRMQHKQGSYRWMVCRGMAVRDSSGKPCRMAGSLTDIHQRKITEQQTLHNAFHDELTGLPNRALFVDRLEQALRRARLNPQQKFAVLLLDIDHFKMTNDSLGHETGNQLLIEFGRRIREHLRAADTVARLGADEFAVLLEDIKSLVEASAIANSVSVALRKPFNLKEREVFVTAGVGIAISKPKYERHEDILRDAETAMHSAKTGGTARQQAFHTGMHAQVVTLFNLENDLRRAVENNEFFLNYQPIVALQDGRIAGFEALIRWRHPVRGLISPGEFIPVAEETDLIQPMSEWVLRTACAQMRAWQPRFNGAGMLSMSINLSSKTLADGDFIQRIAHILGESDIPGSSMKFEITESAIMDNQRSALASLAQLKAMNVQLLIDDFGTGYSSLSYLHRLPIDVLKIDRSFVKDMDAAEKNAQIVRTIIALAGNLGMQVIAEGVETEKQLIPLRKLNCEYAQGYYFSKPVDSAEIEKLLASNPKW